MSHWKFKVKTVADLEGVTKKLTELLSEYRLFLLNGDLGAGKTTLIKHWMKSLGVQELVTSPTYSLINVYETGSSEYYHMDLYRLNDSDELREIGIEEYLNSTTVCIVEWPSLLIDFIDEDWINVSISMDNDHREICLEVMRLDNEVI